MLATAPDDVPATILKARALVWLRREADAIDLLTKHIQDQPTDGASLALLAKIYERRDDWAKVAAFAQRVRAIAPTDQENALLLIEAAFRSGNIELGRKTSSELLQPTATDNVNSCLILWAEDWDSAQRIADARRLAVSRWPPATNGLC